MPPLAAAIVAAEIVASEVAAYVLIATVVVTLASVAYSAYMMASMESPKHPDAQSRLNTVRSSVQSHRMIYGDVMTGGVLVYAQSHDSVAPDGSTVPNGYITLVVAFTGHEVEAISEIWLNDKISTDATFIKHVPAAMAEGYTRTDSVRVQDGAKPTEYHYEDVKTWVETKAAVAAHDESYSTITKYRGTPDQEADPLLISLPAKPSVQISQKPSSGLDDLVVYNPYLDVYLGTYTGSGASVFNISVTDTGATDTFHWTQSKYSNDGTALEIVASGTLVMNGSVQALADGVGIAFGHFEPNKNFTFVTTGHSIGQSWEVRAFDGSPWTADCKLTGRSYVVVTLENSDTAFPNGLPNIRARIKGNNQIYDPRTGTTGYSDNWALCVRDYLTKPYGLGSPADEINTSAAIAAANICDELVALADGTTQKRYTINGSFTVDKTPTTIMNEILATAFGAITWTQGQYRILPAAYYAPDPTFHGMNRDVPGLTESDLRGPIKVRPMPSMKDRFNTVKGTYISPETWQPVDFPVVRNALYKSQDGGEEIPRDVQLSYVTDSRRAQRIAKIMLEKSRQGITVDFPAKWSAFPLAVGDNVPVSIAYLGWVQKIFTVKDWKMNPGGGVDLQLQEEAEGCYAWNNGEETTVDLAQNTILADPRFVPTPTGLTVGEELYATNVGSVIKCRAILTWNSVGARQYEVNYLAPNNTIWAPLPLTMDTTCLVDDTIPGSYSFRVRGMNALGVWGDWATVTATLKGKTAPPPPVDSFTLAVVPNNGMRKFSWTMLAPPLDLAGFRIRYNIGSALPWEDMQELHTQLLTASPYETNQLGAGTFIFAIVAEDTTGNISSPIYLTATLVAPGDDNLLLLEQPHLMGWPGSTDWTSPDAMTWDTTPDTWDAWNDHWCSGNLTLTYTHTVIDLGKLVTFTPFIEAAGSGGILIEMRTSADNVTWSDWGVPSKTSSRYLQVRVTVIADTPSLTALEIYLNGSPFEQNINDLDTSTLTGANRIGVGDIRLPIEPGCSVVKQINVVLQSVGAGWSWVLIDKDTAVGPRIKIYNGSNVLADALIDATIKGV